MTIYRLLEEVTMVNGRTEWIMVESYRVLTPALKDYSKLSKMTSNRLRVAKITEEEIDVNNNELGMEI